MRITLKHIADKTGYSISTVSRVLNGTNKISLDVQRRIVQVAEELEYPFNKNQIPMYSNGTKDVVLISELAHGEFYASAYTGYFNAAAKLDVNLSLVSANQHEKSLFDIITARIQHQVDGIALFVPTMEHKDYKKLLDDLNKAQVSIPIISNGLIENPIVPTITFDGYSGGFVAAECFDQRNMKKVGIVKGPLERQKVVFVQMALRIIACITIWKSYGNYRVISLLTVDSSPLNPFNIVFNSLRVFSLVTI